MNYKLKGQTVNQNSLSLKFVLIIKCRFLQDPRSFHA